MKVMPQIVVIAVWVIVSFIVLWLLRYALQTFPQGEPVDKLANFAIIALGVIVIIWAILAAFGAAPTPRLGVL